MGTQFNKYDILENAPATNDTYLVYDASAGSIKQVEIENASKVLDGRQVFVQSSQPDDSESEVGDIWFDIS